MNVTAPDCFTCRRRRHQETDIQDCLSFLDFIRFLRSVSGRITQWCIRMVMMSLVHSHLSVWANEKKKYSKFWQAQSSSKRLHLGAHQKKGELWSWQDLMLHLWQNLLPKKAFGFLGWISMHVEVIGMENKLIVLKGRKREEPLFTALFTPPALSGISHSFVSGLRGSHEGCFNIPSPPRLTHKHKTKT